ncbi:MAG TPA: hypothetical protein PLU17_06870 [Chitinophagaceae bacterium]|nr:hypothetical protein [Chitinophagaceae bacterium]
MINKDWLKTNKNPVTPKEFCRPADQTFLTFPEWYLVFSPDEQAQYYKKITATSFPFKSHTAQIWESYRIINDQIREDYEYNLGYHFMIWVIGSSATIEYSIKSWYETIIGRLTDTYYIQTDEDKFNADFTQAYVNFIKDHPWYEFNFKQQLIKLWNTTSFYDQYFLRKLERKYFLTSELLVKFIYGKLIGIGTQSVYEEALPTTEVLVEGLKPDFDSTKIIKKYANQSLLIQLPRYDLFNAAIVDAAKHGAIFKEIAGNNSAILLSVLVSNIEVFNYKNTQIIFTQPIASDPTKKRIAFAVQVKNLNSILLELDRDKVFIEHVFDY